MRIQLDNRYFDYRQQKLQAREEKRNKYYCQAQPSPTVQQALVRYLIRALTEEYPQWFQLHTDANAGNFLHCALTQEGLHFDEEQQLHTVIGASTSGTRPPPAYLDAVDALAMQMQEDICVCELNGEDNQLTLLHLCYPNHWCAEDKIGTSFSEAHRMVPGMGPILRKQSQLLQMLTQRGPWVRFAWGLATDTRLNHHPQAPESSDPDRWQGRHFDPQAPQLFVRCERQVTQVLVPQRAFVFTIRTYFQPVERLGLRPLQALLEAITSMDELTLRYKGLLSSKPSILAWLRTLQQDQSTIKTGKGVE